MINKTRTSSPHTARLSQASDGPERGQEPIAIIGMGCRFPGSANDPQSFWTILAEARDVITPIPPERWSESHFHHPRRGLPGKTQARWGGFVDQIDQFDARAFGISPREATRMDPQQRMLLETAWEALEDGGQPLERLAGTNTAVFVGISSWDYAYQGLSFQDRGIINPYSNTGGSHSIAANRISYCFDLRGPSSAVDTACSSALLAVHLACRSIWNEGCPLALAGGVNALLVPDFFVAFSQLSMLSPSGRCRAFDAAADGFVRSEGAGMVLLKPLHRAVADRDRIYAVICGSAVNQDGRTPGMTVPSQEAQEALVAAACQSAGILPRDVGYVEAHGTGTLVGDPIEARALGAVLGKGRPVAQPCILGSVKTNIGHLEAGAGIASLMKVALAMHHGMIPANLHFQQPNPEIDFQALGLHVPVRAEPWPRGADPRWAGINSFGYGGTNVHLVLQDGPAPRASTGGVPATAGSSNGQESTMGDERHRGDERFELIPLSARSPGALHQLLSATRGSLEQLPPGVSFPDWVGNMVHRRSYHDHRLTLVARSPAELIQRIGERAEDESHASGRSERVAAGASPRVAFVCSGQGPQWWAMGRRLLETEPLFREVIRRCDTLIQQLGFWSLWDELTADESQSRMSDTAISQPAIFALQVALIEVWRSWGVQPVAVVGHSVGEVAAAHLAGIFSLEDAIRVIYQRGRCMSYASSEGGMLAVGLTCAEAEEVVAGHGDRVTIAAVNSPASVTLSGDPRLLDQIASQLQARRIFQRRLQVQYAFHSRQMDPIRDNLLLSLQGIRPMHGALPMISTVTGRPVQGPELSPEYWWHNVRDRVRFADAMGCLAALDVDVVVELSPHPVLASAVTESFQDRKKSVTALPSLRRGEDERETMLCSAGALFTKGYPLNWANLAPEPRCFVPTPRYPWQRERLWFESEESRRSRHPVGAHPLLGTLRGGPDIVWQRRLDLQALAYLSDHRVERAVVFPAAAQVELALAVAAEMLDSGPCRLDDLQFSAPLMFQDDGTAWIETHYHKADGTLQVHSRMSGDAAPWILHGSARLSPGTDRPSAPRSLESLRTSCPHRFAGDDFYRYSDAIGLDYGPTFQGIVHGRQGRRESLARVEFPEAIAGESELYQFHPALLDACFQVVIAADDDFDDFVGPLYLPVGIEQVLYYQRPRRAVWVHARIREKTAHSLVADLEILDETGEILVEIRGLASRRTTGTSYQEKIADLLYEYQWRPSGVDANSETSLPARMPAGDPPPGTPAGRAKIQLGPSDEEVSPGGNLAASWLILADRKGIGRQLARQLECQGAHCTLVFGGEEFARRTAGHYEMKAADRQQMETVVAEYFSRPACFRGVIHLWNLDAPRAADMTTDQLEEWQDYGTISLLHLIQAWEAVAEQMAAAGVSTHRADSEPLPVGQRSPLLLVTSGAQAIGGSAAVVEVAQSPVIGLGRVVIGEYAGLQSRLVDLDPNGLERAAEALLAEIALVTDHELGDDEDEVAWRDSRRLVHRFLPARRTEISQPSPETPYRLEMDQAGTLDRMQLRTMVRRDPQRGEVEIEVRAAALNFSDVMKALGLYPGMKDSQVRLGAECSGVITRVGPDVPGLTVGDEVVAVAPHSFASHVVTQAELVAPKPARLTFEQAASLPIAFLTAYYGMEHLGRLQPEERVLIHSASGGVGLAAIQLARRIGAEIFATAGSEEKREYLRREGIEHVSDSRSLDFAEEIRRASEGRGVDMILNSLAGEAIRRGMELLSAYGRFLEIGKRDIHANMPLGLRPFRQNLSFYGIDLDQLMQDRPELLGRQLRGLMKDFAEGSLEPLPCHVFPMMNVVEAFRWMQQGKHIGKVVVSPADAPASLIVGDQPLQFEGQATYLITGGLGGFGTALARWLVDRGARNLVLMSRRGADSPAAQEIVAKLSSQDTRVTVYQGDVSQRADVSSLLDQLRQSHPPLRGVFHAAMVLEDGLLRNLDRDWMRRVMAPKVQGGWNLHELTKELDLDHFVLFSSLSSVFGHAGQGNYAAANAFLDQLAHYRRSAGLPCLTVNWGYLGDVGYLAERPQLGERLRRQGVLSFTVRQALDCLAWGLTQCRTQLSVMHVDWSRWRGLGVAGPVSPRFRHLLVSSSDDMVRTAGGSLTLASLRAMTTNQRIETMTDLLSDKVAQVLGSRADRMDRTTPLLDLGLDSLMAVELRNWIEGRFQLNVPIVELVRSPSLTHVAERLSLQLADEPETDEPSETPRSDLSRRAEMDPRELLDRLDQLSGQDVDDLLTTLLDEKAEPMQ